MTGSPVFTGPSTCYPRASAVMIKQEEGIIAAFEVKVFSYTSDNTLKNVALEGTASQSSTFQNNEARFGASNAIDSNGSSYSHTKSRGTSGSPWWKIDLPTSSKIESVVIKNRYCGTPEDTPGCLCRISGAMVQLFDSQGVIVAEKSLGDNTCEQLTLELKFEETFECSNEVSLFLRVSHTLSRHR